MADRPGEADALIVAAALQLALDDCDPESDFSPGQMFVDALAALDRLTARLSEAEHRAEGWVQHDTKAYRDAMKRTDARLAEAEARLSDYEQALRRLQALVDEQAEDEALWALNLDGTLPISEAYLQQELRRLHAAIEAMLARAALSGNTQTNHLHECCELNRKLTELITEAIDGEMGFRSTSDMRDFLLHGMENM